MKKGSFKIPNTFVIVFSIILLAAIATWIVPGGKYERITTAKGDTTIVKDSFKYEKNNPQYLTVFSAPLKGFVKLANIIGFVFFVGGAFYVIQKTGAINAGITELVRRMKGKEKLVIVIIMTIFSFFGAFFGMCEEAMPFVLVFVPLALAMGYDSITGVCLSFLAAGIGFATAFFNPFTVQIAQRFAGIPQVSGLHYRLWIWVFITFFTIFWVVRYAEKIKKNPELSLTYEGDIKRRAELAKETKDFGKFNMKHASALMVLALGIVGLLVGVIVYKWYIVELAALFIAMGIIGGLVGGLNGDEVAKGFIEGAKDIASAALIIGFAAGIIVILEDGNIMDSILHGMAEITGESVPLLSSYIMYWVQMALNFVIPSGTTKAALTMPLFAPLADLTGITRQTAVLAYQFGDGFTNMIIPTSGVTVGTLAMAKVPFEKWFKWLLPLQIIFIIFSMLLLIPPVLLHWKGF
ncbi:MAG: putative basic amino acid antiporter YfcC [bacterium]|nr:putative basic amino acid antiporter YfcC [bacterium]